MYHVTKIFNNCPISLVRNALPLRWIKKNNIFFNRRIKGSLVYVLSHFMRGKGMGWVSFCPILARYEYRGEQRSVTPPLTIFHHMTKFSPVYKFVVWQTSNSAPNSALRGNKSEIEEEKNNSIHFIMACTTLVMYKSHIILFVYYGFSY